MDKPEKEHNAEDKNSDDDDNCLSLSLGVITLKLTGKMLGVFLPYAGLALLFLAAAYAATVVISAFRE